MCLVCACLLASRGLSLRSRRHVNSEAKCLVGPVLILTFIEKYFAQSGDRRFNSGRTRARAALYVLLVG